MRRVPGQDPGVVILFECALVTLAIGVFTNRERLNSNRQREPDKEEFIV